MSMATMNSALWRSNHNQEYVLALHGKLIPSFFAKHRPPCDWASDGSSGRRAIPLAIFAI